MQSPAKIALFASLALLMSGPANAAVTGLVNPDMITATAVTSASVPINISTGTTTQLVAGVTNKRIYVTAFNVVSAGTGNFTLEYGDDTNCASNPVVLTGAYNLTAQAGLAPGSGMGPILVVPINKYLCALTTAAVQMSGSLAYAQF